MLELSVTLAEQAGSLDMLAARLQALGALRMQSGDWRGAVTLLGKSAQHAESLQLHGIHGPTLLALAQCHAQLHDPEQALTFYKRAADVLKEHGPPRQYMEARCGIGMAILLKGNLAEGMRLLEAALPEARGVLHPIALLTVTSNLATLYQHHENWEAAIRCLEEAVEACRQLGDPHRLAALLMQLGHARHMRPDKKGGEAAFSEAIAILREHGPSVDLATALTSLGAVRASARLNPHDAEGPLKEAVSVARQLTGPEGRRAQGTALANLGFFYLKVKRIEEAQGTLISAKGLLERDGQDPEVLEAVRGALRQF
jgi:tetratricopeptide (TPR) repeat protein